MENNEAFEAEAALEVRQRSQRPHRRGNGMTKSIIGGSGSRRESDYDETPLLSREANHDYGSRSDTPDQEESRGPPEWSGERDFEGKPWWNRPSIFWLLPPFLLFTLAWGGIVIPRLDLIYSLVCRQYFDDRPIDGTTPVMPVVFGINNPQCEIPEVQSLASKFTLYQSIIAGLLSACTNPSLGALSDRYGRRKIIAFTALGMLLSELILIIAAIYPDMVHVNWILLGSVFEGLSGSFIAALALTNAYASDCTAPSRRSVALGYFHSILFGGIALGPVLAGYIVKGTGDILSVFWIALACHGIFFLFLMFIIPESVSYNRQMAAREKQQKQKDINSDDHRPRTWGATVKRTLKSWNIFAPLSTLWPTGAGTTSALRRNLALIAAVDFTMFGVTMGSMTVVVYYSEFMFHWDILATTKFISVVNTCRVTCLVVLLPLIARVLRGKKTGKPARQSGSDRVDLAVIRTAIFFDMLGYVGYATVRTGGLFILSGAIASIGGMGSPTLQSAVTKHVPPDKTGQVLGAMGLLHALARVLGPVVFNSIYATTVGKCPQTVFMCLAATFGVAFVLSWGIRPYVHWDEAEHSASHPSVDDEEQPEGSVRI